jgi:hypothetical protein
VNVVPKSMATMSWAIDWTDGVLGVPFRDNCPRDIMVTTQRCEKWMSVVSVRLPEVGLKFQCELANKFYTRFKALSWDPAKDKVLRCTTESLKVGHM